MHPYRQIKPIRSVLSNAEFMGLLYTYMLIVNGRANKQLSVAASQQSHAL